MLIVFGFQDPKNKQFLLCDDQLFNVFSECLLIPQMFSLLFLKESSMYVNFILWNDQSMLISFVFYFYKKVQCIKVNYIMPFFPIE